MKKHVFLLTLLLSVISVYSQDSLSNGDEKPVSKSENAFTMSFFHLVHHQFNLTYRHDFKDSRFGVFTTVQLQPEQSKSLSIYEIRAFEYDSIRSQGLDIGGVFNVFETPNKMFELYTGLSQGVRWVDLYYTREMWEESSLGGIDVLTLTEESVKSSFVQFHTTLKFGIRAKFQNFVLGADSSLMLVINNERSRTVEGLTRRIHDSEDGFYYGSPENNVYGVTNPFYLHLGIIF
ncbi:hypothetical protein OAH12_01375 [Cyclobacteriaceae bacterium]|nr:hypothetical protein [Cyclobacteriaceae bacterium]